MPKTFLSVFRAAAVQLRRLAFLFLPLAAVGSLGGATTSASSDGFDPSVNGNVYSALVQKDGKIVIGGSFTTVQPFGLGQPITRNRLARFHSDGTLDTSFDPNLDGEVVAIAQQADGRLLIGGRFTNLQPAGASSATERLGLVRLNTDGSIDSSFNPRPTGQTASQSPVSAIIVQLDGKIVIGGGFTSLRPNTATSATTRQRVARLLGTGELDTSFSPGANNLVLALALQSDGKILLGGGFTTLTPTGGSAVERKRLARLNADGTLDTGFNVAADNRVLALALHPNGTIMLGGDFRSLQPAQDSAATSRNFLARLTSAGAIDTSFNAVPSAYVSTIIYQSDGKLLIGGNFTSVWPSGNTSTSPVSRQYLARLSYTGQIDDNFNASCDAAVATIALQSDSRIVLGGYFARITGSDTTNSLSRSRAARLQPDGSLDARFGSILGGSVSHLARQPDGAVLVSGSFSAVAGATRYNLARISSQGVLDSSFQPRINGRVGAAAVQTDGRIVIAGSFSNVNGVQRSYIARLNGDGSLDESYYPTANAAITALALQSDGKLIAGGSFTTFQPNGATSTTSANYLARLNVDGTLDTAYLPTPNAGIYTLTLQSDGLLLVGGAFTAFAPNGSSTSTTRNYAARIKTDGTVDGDFNPNLNNYVYSIALQTDGKIVLGGAFTQMAPNGATTATTRKYLARVDSKGAVDTTFDPAPNNAVFSLLPQTDGTLFIGGAFSTVQPNSASSTTDALRVALLKSDGTLASFPALFLNGEVTTFLKLSDTSVLAGGSFTAAYTADGVSIPVDAHVLRLSAAGVLDANFTLTAGNVSSSAVNALALQPTGELIVGGSFSGLGGGTTTHLARLTGNGEPDVTFTTSTDQPVHAIAVQPLATSTTLRPKLLAWLETTGSPRSSFNVAALQTFSGFVASTAFQADGKLLVAGEFSNSTGATRSHLVRFNVDGTLDLTFLPETNASVRTLAVQPDGNILIGGSFTTVNGATRNRIARLRPDGVLDASFDPNCNELVSTVRLLSDGKILIGGSFTTVQPNSASSSTARNYFARLNADGSLDTAFNPNFNNAVQTVILDGDKYLVGGSFTSATPNGASSSTTRNYLARLNSDGSLDTTYDPAANAAVTSLARQADGRVIVGGAFTSFKPNSASTSTARYYIARLNTDGTLDESFNPSFNASLSAVALASDGAIYVGGSFTAALSTGSTATAARYHLARITTDGRVDSGFAPFANGPIYTVNIHADGSIIAGGNFTQVGTDPITLVAGAFQTIAGAEIPYLARISIDGNQDPSFRPQPNGAVRALAVHADGRFYAGGDFTSIGGSSRGRLARFQRNGSIDTGFNAQVDGAVHAVVLQPDGKLLIGGNFSSVNGIARSRLARLGTDGSVDAGFNPGADGTVFTLAVQRDGRVLAAGDFASIGGGARARLARLNADGSLDTSFNPAPDGAVFSIGLQADGHLYVGGEFQNIAGYAQPRFARLNSDGSLDSSVTASVNGAVQAIAVQEDGRPLVGGNFTSVNGQSRYLVARLGVGTATTQSLSVNSDRSVITWARSGSAPNVASVLFETSTDGTSWTTLGFGSRSTIAEVWQWSGASNTFPADSVYYIRAVSAVPTSRNSSSSVVETQWQFFGSSAVGPNAQQLADNSAAAAANDSTSSNSNSSGSSTDAGSGTSSGAVTSTGSSSTTSAGLVNLSTRIQMTSQETVITGFVITGAASKRVLVRAIGPGLKPLGISNVVTRPQLELLNVSGEKLLMGQSWEADPAYATAFNSAGVFPLASGSADSVAVATLAPGAYTLHVRNLDGTAGVLLTEIYEVDRDSAIARFINLSARATSAEGEKVLIGGFIIQGDAPVSVMVRGLGPALATQGISGTLPDPRLRIYDSAGTQIAENDNWSATEVAAATARVGAAALVSGSKDAAMVLTLNPGAYTGIVSDVNGVSGVGLIEIFDLR